MDKKLLTPQEAIKKLAEQDIKLSERMLNFYKAQGLLLYTKTLKAGGGFKCLYPVGVIERISYIKELQRRDFTLLEIKKIICEGGMDLVTERVKKAFDLWDKTYKKRESGELLKVKKYSSTYAERIQKTEQCLLGAQEILSKIWSGVEAK